MKHIIFFALFLAAVVVGQASPYLQMTSAPSSVASGTSYYIEAGCWDMGGLTVTIYKNGSYFASSSGMSPVYCGGSTSDTGAQTVEYRIEAVNDYYETDTIYHYVTITGTPTTFSLSPNPATFTYNGSTQGPSVVPSPSNATYAVTGGTPSATNAGSYSVTVVATGNFTGSATLNWSIARAPATFSLYPVPPTFIYNGSPQGPSVVASPAGATFTTGGTLSATNASNYTATATATGNYIGSNSSLSWNIIPAPTTFSLSQTSFTYNGSAQGPSVIALPSGATFTPGGILSATNVGNYNASATAYGNYSGSNPSLGWSITVPPPPPPPVITSPLSASGTVGVAFNYQITATNSPTSYSASGLPSGLSVDEGNGAISGIPTSAGSFNVNIGATNGGGSGSATLVLSISSLPPDGDYDGDGLTNAEENLLGTSPTTANPAGDLNLSVHRPQN